MYLRFAILISLAFIVFLVKQYFFEPGRKFRLLANTISEIEKKVSLLDEKISLLEKAGMISYYKQEEKFIRYIHSIDRNIHKVSLLQKSIKINKPSNQKIKHFVFFDYLYSLYTLNVAPKKYLLIKWDFGNTLNDLTVFFWQRHQNSFNLSRFNEFTEFIDLKDSQIRNTIKIIDAKEEKALVLKLKLRSFPDKHIQKILSYPENPRENQKEIIIIFSKKINSYIGYIRSTNSYDNILTFIIIVISHFSFFILISFLYRKSRLKVSTVGFSKIYSPKSHLKLHRLKAGLHEIKEKPDSLHQEKYERENYVEEIRKKIFNKEAKHLIQEISNRDR